MYLALDTAAARASLALGDERGAVLAEARADLGVRRSEALLPALADLLARAGVVPDALGGVVLGAGPGSFTGVRIAAAAGKGVAHALGLPLYAHGSLEAMSAGAALVGRLLLPLIPARRDEVFAACYRVGDGPPVEVEPPRLLLLEGAIAWAREHGAVAIGPGAERHAHALRAAGVAAHPERGLRAAVGLLRLHALHGEAGRVADPWSWEPRYLRAEGDEGDGQPTG